jgi:biotin-dependent carboxylase-like uncharacterized protein
VIEVLSTFALNTVQDLGRFGSRHLGVGTSGVMDPLALTVGNILLGNPDDAAGIEIQTFPFELRFQADTAFAVTGADCTATLDGRLLPPWWTAPAKAGQVLKLHPPKRGARSYLTLAGGVDVPVILGSRSTHLRSEFGGFLGRALAKGDVVGTAGEAGGPARLGPDEFGAEPADIALPPGASGETDSSDDTLPIRVLRAGEYELFPQEARQRFWRTAWKITHQSDRAGYRLGGEPLKLASRVEMRSYGIVAGVVQVPPSGEPIIQLSDANTAGGYPKIAGVVEADLWRLAQARIGSCIRFVDTTYDDAVAAMAPVDAYLAQIRRVVELYRQRPR